jgi:hypothetical protein
VLLLLLYLPGPTHVTSLLCFCVHCPPHSCCHSFILSYTSRNVTFFRAMLVFLVLCPVDSFCPMGEPTGTDSWSCISLLFII